MLKCVLRTTGLTAATALAGIGASAPSARADFNYANFSSTTGLNLVGVAQQSGSSLMVTPSVGASAGAVWVSQKQGISTGFDTTLTIHIQDKLGGGSDGLALVIQNSSATALGGTGGAMGYARNLVYDQPGISNCIAISFDMWDNTSPHFDWSEPGNNHVTIQSRGLLENYPSLPASLASAVTPDLSDGLEHTIRVNYTAGVLSVYLDGSLSPTVQALVNLSTLLSLDSGLGGPAGAWVGVTAGTGAPQDSQAHVIDSWVWQTTPVPAPGSAGLLALGGLVAAKRRRR